MMKKLLIFFFLPGCFLFPSKNFDKDVMFIADKNLLPCPPRMKEKECWRTSGYKYENGRLVKINIKILNFSTGGYALEGKYAHVSIEEKDHIKEENPSYKRLCEFYEGQIIEEECHFRKNPPFKDYCETSRDSKLKTKLCSRYHITKDSKD